MNTWSFSLPIPPSVNATHRHGGGRCWLSTEYQDWRMATRLTLSGQSAGLSDKPVGPYAIWIDIRGGKGWRANRDMDNCGKAILDILQIVGIIEGDSTEWVQRIVFTFAPPIKGQSAALMVTIEEWRALGE